MKLKAYLRERDIFGKRIEISDSHKTPAGGLASLVLRFAMAVYVVSLFRTMFTYDDDKTYQHRYSIAMTDEGSWEHNQVAVEDTGIVFYFALYLFGPDGIQRNLPYSKHTQRYIKARFAQKATDFTEADEADYHNFTFHNAKSCEESDFTRMNTYAKHEDKMADLFHMWDAFYILCPDLRHEYNLVGTDAHLKYDSFLFQLSKCSNDTLEATDEPCAPEDEIEEFVNRVFVETWASFLSVDFQIRNTVPFQRSEKWLKADLMESEHRFVSMYQITRHVIETEDSFFQLGQVTHADEMYDLQLSHNHRMLPDFKNPGALFEAEFILNQHAVKHVRIIYNIMDVLGDMAGIFELATSIVGFFLLSVSQHSMTINTIKKLFLVRTHDDHLFHHKDKKATGKDVVNKGIQKYLDPEITEYIQDLDLKEAIVKYNKKICLTELQSVQLYFVNLYNKWMKALKMPAKLLMVTKLTVLYEECEQRLDKSLNILKLLKDIKYMKLLLKFKINPEIETKFQIHHCAKNVINLDALYSERVQAVSGQIQPKLTIGRLGRTSSAEVELGCGESCEPSPEPARPGRGGTLRAEKQVVIRNAIDLFLKNKKQQMQLLRSSIRNSARRREQVAVPPYSSDPDESVDLSSRSGSRGPSRRDGARSSFSRHPESPRGGSPALSQQSAPPIESSPRHRPSIEETKLEVDHRGADTIHDIESSQLYFPGVMPHELGDPHNDGRSLSSLKKDDSHPGLLQGHPRGKATLLPPIERPRRAPAGPYSNLEIAPTGHASLSLPSLTIQNPNLSGLPFLQASPEAGSQRPYE